MNTATIAQKLWNHCNVLRDDGMSYGDYVEQLTYLLFLKMADERIRRKRLHDCDVHTLLRLPTGLFYAQGVKANVLFFDKKPAAETPWTRKLWIYDLRTNMHFTLKTNTLMREDMDEFVKCYHPQNRHDRKATWSADNPDGRWRAYDYEELVNRGKASLDIFWLKDESLSDSDNLPAPEVIAAEIVEDLEAWVYQVSNMLEPDPLKVSCRLNERPTSVRGKVLWPEQAMREAVAAL